MRRVTVNLTQRATAALESACCRARENKTDAINHALPVLVMVLDIQARSGGWLNVVRPDGQLERIYLI